MTTKWIRPFGKIFFTWLTVAILPGMAVWAEESNPQQRTVDQAEDTVARFAADPDMQWFRDYVVDAMGVLVVPVSVKGGFIVGASGGVGALLNRGDDGSWSHPAFYQLTSVSLGLQAGADVSEVILVVMSEAGRDALLSTELKLGADVSVAAGPVGAGAKSQTADVLAFSRSSGGLYGGLNLEGSLIKPKPVWNQSYYGQVVSPREILLERSVSNSGADALRDVIASVARPPAQ